MKPVSNNYQLNRNELKKDRRAARRFGPCGIGPSAVYMGSLLLDRYYYAPAEGIERIWKRIAMSKGGFTGRGAFGSIPYIVIRMKDGTERSSSFRSEDLADAMLVEMEQRFPGIPTKSREAQARLQAKLKEQDARKKKDLSEDAQKTLASLRGIRNHLERKMFISRELSDAGRHLRSFNLNKGVYGWTALIITLMGVAALIFGVASMVKNGFHLTGGEQMGDFGIFFVLFGFAAIFMFAGLSVLPTAKNNRKAVEKRVKKAEDAVFAYMNEYDRDAVLLIPARYGHPVVAEWMIREIEEGRATGAEEALDGVKKKLKSLNSSVTVDREVYDEVIQIKALFLNADYR